MSEQSAALPGADQPREVPFRGGGFLPRPKPLHSWLAFAGFVALWQGALSAGWLDQVFLPSPGGILRALGHLVVTGDLWRHLSASLLRIGLGWLIGSALGLVIGIAMGLSSLSRAVGMPVVSAIYPVPKIALLPLLILWLGIGEAPKVATIAAGVFFPTVIGARSRENREGRAQGHQAHRRTCPAPVEGGGGMPTGWEGQMQRRVETLLPFACLPLELVP